MNKALRKLFVLLLILAFACPAAADTADKTGTNRLNIAFGLFSVALPEGTTAGPNTGNVLSDFRFEAEDLNLLIYANYAPAEEYEKTAGARLNSLLSYLYAFSGPNYSETEVCEETLENGISLRWQYMQGDLMHSLYFEADDGRYRYNMSLSLSAEEADKEAVLKIMRSFRTDPEMEDDLSQIRQTKLEGGSFISVEHGLEIHLDEEWEIVPYKDYLLPGTAFMLVKDEGMEMIQLFSDHPVQPEESREWLDWFLDAKGSADTAGDPYQITLEGLGGIEAWAADEKPGVHMIDIAFVYENYCYYGMLMWVPENEETARPFMQEALRTLSSPEE